MLIVLVSLSLRAIPDRRKKDDGVVNEIFLAQLSLLSKNGTESSVCLGRAKNKTRKTIIIVRLRKTSWCSKTPWRSLGYLYTHFSSNPHETDQNLPIPALQTRNATELEAPLQSLPWSQATWAAPCTHSSSIHSTEQLHWSLSDPGMRVPLTWK